MLILALKLVSSVDLYDLKAADIFGLDVDFQRFRGQVLLIVNVASQCGYTESHYQDLQRIQDILGNDDFFSVLGFPCNQFGEQEPEDEAAIDVSINKMHVTMKPFLFL